MDAKEVAAYLRIPTEQVSQLIMIGLPLPKSGKLQKLTAHQLQGQWVIDDADLDAFQAAFHAEQPGRHPPTRVMRRLRVEAQHKCAISRDVAPLHFHHILEWNKVQHYDPAFMLAICGVCHDRIGRGEIDYREQLMYKDQLLMRSADLPALDAQFQSLIATGRAKALLASLLPRISTALEQTNSSDVVSQDFDYVNLDTKNLLNRMSREFFEMMLEEDELHVTKIDHLLKLPSNAEIKAEYLKLVSDIKSRMAVYAESGLKFEFCLLKLRDALGDQPNLTELDLRMIKALTSFMYVNCDIGRKHAKT